MAELLDVLDAFSLPLKVAWVVWLAWGVAQAFWFRREREQRGPVARSAPLSRHGGRKALPSPSAPAVTRLVTPDSIAEVPAGGPSSGLNPTTTVVQPLAESTSNELDAIVADFERHNGFRRGRRQLDAPHTGS